MKCIKSDLRSFLTGASSIAVLCIGSELRSDDAAGILIGQKLLDHKKKFSKKIKFDVFMGHTAPENLTGEIRKFRPTHLIMIDTTESGKQPGEISVFTPDQATGISFSTHKLPLKLMTEYLNKEVGCKMLLIGIQPKTIEFGQTISKEVKRSTDDLINELGSILSNNLPSK